MGVIHKLRPDVRDFIVGQKKTAPALSCRALTILITEKLGIKVSKSSINSLFQEAGLSLPVGRRAKIKKHKDQELGQRIKFALQGPVVLPVIEPAGIQEAEEWAIKLQEEERIRVEEKLSLEKQRLKDEDLKTEVEEADKKTEQERLTKEAEERARLELEETKRLEEAANKVRQDRLAKEAEELARQAEEERKRSEEDVKQWEEAANKVRQDRLAKEAEELARQAEEEKKRLAEEVELKAEKEKMARLAEEKFQSEQRAAKTEVNVQKDEISLTGLLPQDRVCSGAIFLKAIDYLIGGSKQINEAICKSTGKHPEDCIALTQAVIFRSLFGPDKGDFASLGSLVGQQIPQEKLENYYLEINQNKTIISDIAKIILNVFTEARGVKVHLIDGSLVYLDGQMHTIWPTPYLPYDFTSPVYELRNNLNNYFFKAQPFVLLSAPGYDVPTKEFFNLLSNINSSNKGPDNLILYGNKLEEFESISLNYEKNYSFVFGLWPWQFTTCRKIKKIGNFNLEHVEGTVKDLYLAEIEVDLLQPATNQSITFQGCALKTDLQEKIRVVILSSDRGLVNLNKLAQIYLSHWPNLDEGFQDFNRKVEVFTYTGSTQKFFSTENLGLNITETRLELGETFANYIKILDVYLRWHFLPVGYTEKDFSFTNECFYKVPVELATSQARVTAKIQTSQPKTPLKDLEYLLRRLNERQIDLGNGQAFYFENAFK